MFPVTPWFKLSYLQKILGFFRLARPANIVTAFSDIGAGVAIALYALEKSGLPFSGEHHREEWLSPVLLLLLATLGLYGGGVVMNDVFDAKLDKEERPERPIPSGLVTKKEAATWGMLLLLTGILAAGLVHRPPFFFLSFWIALAIAMAALLYDAWGKHQAYFGPVNMGICRGLNLLLGMSLVPQAVSIYGYLALVPVIFIAAITMISRGEVHGGKSRTLVFAGVLYAVVIIAISAHALWNGQGIWANIFLVLFGLMIFPPLARAGAQPSGPNIGKAVKAGVLSLILMNAAWVAAFGLPLVALGMLLLLPFSLVLAKAFAVT